jgi:capsular polysaccharide biosynthesis protein
MPEGAQYIAVLRRWSPLALAIVAVATLMGLAVAAQRPKSYTADAKVLLGQDRQLDALLGTADYSPDPERDLNTSLQLITLEPIAGGVVNSLGLHESPTALAARVTTAVDRNSNIVTISVRDASPDHAAEIANAFANGYHDYRAKAAQAALRDAIDSAQQRLPTLETGSARTALRRELTRLEVVEPLQTGGVQVVHEATAADAVQHPRPLVSGVVGGLLGLIIAAVAIVVLARTDRRVSGDGDLEDVTGRPLLARIPRSPQAAADALASLALSLVQKPRGTAPPSVVLVTSAGPHEGAPEVAIGLARAFGVIGRSAIAIEADLRRPAFAALVGVETEDGLATVLAGQARLDDELVAVGERTSVLPAGTTSDAPQAMLAGELMASTVAAACRLADIIVLDGIAGDAVALAPLVDTVLLVARDDVTRPDALRRAVRALADAGIPPAGVVALARGARFPLRPEPTSDDARATAHTTTGATSEVTVG